MYHDIRLSEEEISALKQILNYYLSTAGERMYHDLDSNAISILDQIKYQKL